MHLLLPDDPRAFYQWSFQNNSFHVLSNIRNDLYSGNFRPDRATFPSIGGGFGKAEFSEMMTFHR